MTKKTISENFFHEEDEQYNTFDNSFATTGTFTGALMSCMTCGGCGIAGCPECGGSGNSEGFFSDYWLDLLDD
jgi:purine-nucleoside phosphorylase